MKMSFLKLLLAMRVNSGRLRMKGARAKLRVGRAALQGLQDGSCAGLWILQWWKGMVA
jgi:hypothetical protein